MSSQKFHGVFAIVGDNWVYIGKNSSTQGISSPYYRHLGGKASATQDAVQATGKPGFHLLQVGTWEAYEVYRLILAYARVFQDAGYRVLNCPRTLERAYDLKPETQQLLNEIQREPLALTLARTRVCNVAAANRVYAKHFPQPEAAKKPVKKPKAKRQSITVSATEEEKNRFRNFAEEMHMTHRQAFQYLIATTDRPEFVQETDAFVRNLIQEHEDKLHIAAARNQALQERMEIARINNRDRVERKDERAKVIREGVRTFLRHMESNYPPSDEGPAIGRFRDFADREEYQFPEAPGAFVFRPLQYFRSKGSRPAIFVIGLGANGEKLKLRVYKKDTFVGIGFFNPRFFHPGSLWVVGVERARDGAMDLIFGIPLELFSRFNDYKMHSIGR